MRCALVWLLVPAVLFAEDVSLPTPVTIHTRNGRVFSAETHGIPLPDAFVYALMQITPPSNRENSTLTLPVKMTVEQFRGSSRQPCDIDSEIFFDAQELSAPKALQREGKLKPDKPNIAERSALILFAADKPESELQQMRYRQIAWLVEHQPDAPVLCQGAATISKVKAPKEYGEVKALWLKALSDSSPKLNVLESGSNFLRVADPEDVHRVLAPLANQLAAIRIWLGEAYAFAGIGMADWDAGKPFSASAGTELPSTPFAASARLTLQQSSDLVLLTSSLSGLKQAGARLKSGGGLPNGFAEFCGSIVRHIRELKPNSEDDCDIPSESYPSVKQASESAKKTLVIKRVQPSYPQAAKTERLGGTLVLHAIIDKKGKVRDVGYLRGPLVFYAESAAAVRQWEYKPYILGGVAIEVPTEIEVVFNIN